MASPGVLVQLRDRLAQVHAQAPVAGALELVTPIARLRLGGLHELFSPGAVRAGRAAAGAWRPPLAVLVDLAVRGLRQGVLRRVVWVGRACWPAPLHLAGWPGLIDASVFVDPPTAASGLWCAEVAARCLHPTLVLADGSGSTLTHSRRLQLAAGAGTGLCVLARPGSEEDVLSVACTRWRITPAPGLSHGPRWTATLLRDKDRPVLTDQSPALVVEWDDAQGLVRLPAAVAGGAAAAGAAAS